MDPVPTCSGPECELPAVKCGLCWGHLKQRQRTGEMWPLGAPARPRARARARSALFDAAVELRDVDSDDDEAFRAAESRFWETFEAAARLEPRGPSSQGR